MVSATQAKLIDASLLPAQVSSQISVSVAAKSLDAARQEGDAAVQLIDAAGASGPQPGDALVAKATGMGTFLDVQA